MKVCTKCHIKKENKTFHRRSAVRDGLNSWCKECCYTHEKTKRSIPEAKAKRAAQRRRLYLKNGGAERLKRRLARKRDRQKYLAYEREYHRANKELYEKACRRYYEKNKPKILARVKKFKDRQLKTNRKHVMLLRREANLRRRGITLGQFVDLLKDQDGLCKICKINRPGGFGTWHIDHDHATRVVRGLLCSKCNLGLGLFRDSPLLLMKAASYLSKVGSNHLNLIGGSP